MTFEEILDQAIAMLQRRGRLTYGALKRQFQLDDAALEDLKDELIEGQRLAVDEDGRVLVWTGGAAYHRPPLPTSHQRNPRSQPTVASQPPHHHLTPNGASSPCCFVTWSTRPRSPASSTRKTCARWCGPIKTPAPR